EPRPVPRLPRVRTRARTRASTIPSFFMSHFNAVEWRAQRSPACSDLVAQLARPAGVVTWQAHEQQGESRRIEACQPEVMCQLKMRGFKSADTAVNVMDHVYSLAHLTAITLSPPELVGIAARTGYQKVGLRLI